MFGAPLALIGVVPDLAAAIVLLGRARFLRNATAEGAAKAVMFVSRFLMYDLVTFMKQLGLGG